MSGLRNRGNTGYRGRRDQSGISEEQQNRSRLRDGGKWEHSNEIRDGAMTQKKVENLKELKMKYIASVKIRIDILNGCGRIDKDSYEGVIGMIACPGKSLKR